MNQDYPAYNITFKLPDKNYSKTYKLNDINIGFLKELAPNNYTPIGLYCESTGVTIPLSDYFYELGNYTVVYKNDINISLLELDRAPKPVESDPRTESRVPLLTIPKPIGCDPRTDCVVALNECNSNPRLKEQKLTIVVVGDLCTGKSSWLNRYVNNIFSTTYKSTISADLLSKVINRDDTKYQLRLWDVSGQELHNTSKIYYDEVDAAIIMFDVAEKSSLDSVIKWKKDIEKYQPGIPIVLVATKVDISVALYIVEYTPNNMDRLCIENEFVGWCKISSKDSLNIDKPCDMLIDSFYL